MRRQPLRAEAPALDDLEQHRGRRGVDQPRGDRHVVGPQPLQPQLDRLAVDADVGHVSSRRDDRLANVERRGNAHRLDGYVHARAAREVHHPLHRLAVGAVDELRGAE